MNVLDIYFNSLMLMAVLGVAGWLLSLWRNNVNEVDSIWSLFFLAAAILLISGTGEMTGKNILLFMLLAVWSTRLSAYLTHRNWGKTEDRRYQAIRANNCPGFRIKSLYIIYMLQAVIASVIFIGLVPGFALPIEFRWLDIIAVSIVVTGIIYESVADWQMMQFKHKHRKPGAVLNTGLWSFSRHPNYFGEFLVWWGFFLMIVTLEYFWVVISPLIVSFLLLKVSGVTLMEKDIKHRRPEYARYIEDTPAFFPRLSNLFHSHKHAGEVS